MHIGIDALYQLQEGGGRTHLQQLLSAWRDSIDPLADQISVFTTPAGAEQLRSVAGANVTFHVFNLPGRHFALRVLWEQTVFVRILARVKLDVLLCPGNMMPLRTRLPTALVFQSPAPYCASTTPGTLGLSAYLRFKLVGWMMQRSAARANQVIFVSEMLHQLFTQRVALDPGRAVVIYYGFEADWMLSVEQTPYPFPYLIYVSSIWPYKNTREVISGYALLRQNVPSCDWRLVIAGRSFDERYFAELKLLVERLGLAEQVTFTGGLSHQAVKALLGGAVAFVYASVCESFGIPLLEAMAAGVPIACGDTLTTREIVSDAALTFDPASPLAIAEGLERLLDPALRQTLIERGHLRAAVFPTWAQTAAQTYTVLRQIALKSAQK